MSQHANSLSHVVDSSELGAQSALASTSVAVEVEPTPVQKKPGTPGLLQPLSLNFADSLLWSARPFQGRLLAVTPGLSTNGTGQRSGMLQGPA